MAATTKNDYDRYLKRCKQAKDECWVTMTVEEGDFDYFGAAEWFSDKEKSLVGECVIQTSYISFSRTEDLTYFMLSYNR